MRQLQQNALFVFGVPAVLNAELFWYQVHVALLSVVSLEARQPDIHVPGTRIARH